MKTLMCLLLGLEGRPMMSLEEFAKLRGKAVRTVQNEVSAAKCPVPMWKDGGSYFCHAADVAKWIDDLRDAALRESQSLSDTYGGLL